VGYSGKWQVNGHRRIRVFEPHKVTAAQLTVKRPVTFGWPGHRRAADQ
jgi:hypothetical protein